MYKKNPVKMSLPVCAGLSLSQYQAFSAYPSNIHAPHRRIFGRHRVNTYYLF
jgi:hypothetical protein